MDSRPAALGLLALILVVPAQSSGAAAPGSEERLRYVDGDGAVWEGKINAHGASLRSGNTRIYLGRSCDARSPQLGRGRWGWANGGVLVTFGRRRIGFPRQESPIQGGACPL